MLDILKDIFAFIGVCVVVISLAFILVALVCDPGG